MVSLATFGAGRFLGPGIKVFGREFGGALGRLSPETKTAGAIARGNAARAPIRAEARAGVAQAQQRLVGGVSNKVARRDRLDIKAIRAQGQIDSQAAFDTARSAYATQQTTTTLTERVLLGGGDPQLAAFRDDPTAVSKGTMLWSVWTDQLPAKWYDDWRARFVTKEGGDL